MAVADGVARGGCLHGWVQDVNGLVRFLEHARQWRDRDRQRLLASSLFEYDPRVD